MFGFLAALGPVGIAAAVVGTVGVAAYGALKDDEYERTTHSNKSEKEAEIVGATKTEKNNKIHQDIKAYKSKQVKRFKDKYDIDINFYSDKSKSSSEVNSIFGAFGGVAIAKELFENGLSEKISVNKKDEVDIISTLEQETEDMIKLIGKLEVKKYEATN
jgi:hypothetical protein